MPTRTVLAAAYVALLAPACFAAALAPVQPKPGPAATLVGRAVLPADTFAPGPTCGRYLGTGTVGGRKGPFIDRQPVQGFSGLLADGGGRFTVLVDNGYGALENSADHRLRIYTVRPRFKTAMDKKAGAIQVGAYLSLRDPDHHLPYVITHAFDPERPLTGADLDPESIQPAPDGGYWIGDEFGPFLIHVDATGKVLERPYPLPDLDHPGQEVRSPQNPLNEESTAVRVMNALAAHGRSHAPGRELAHPMVISPMHGLLADGDLTTVVPERAAAGASSEIFDVKSLQAAGHAVIPWTVNDEPRMQALLKLGVNGLISDRPDLLYAAVAAFDANGDGTPGDYLDAEGLIDPTRFDAQGHRGARDLRPESTFPAFEAALDCLMPTLETDCILSRDGVPVLSHDPLLETLKTRFSDGRPFRELDVRPLNTLTVAQIQQRYRRDKVLPNRPTQTVDLALSPATGAFVKARGLPSPYVMPSLAQLFDFVRFYEAYYRTGEGRGQSSATRRMRNASRVRFNLETKISPEAERRGVVPAPRAFTRAVAGVVARAGLSGRTALQSFDYRTLLVAQQEFPRLQTVLLVEDAVPFAMSGPGVPVCRRKPGPDDLWIGQLEWPWRVTGATHPMRAAQSGGFEAMGLSWDRCTLYPLLEKSLTGASPDALDLFAFDLKTRAYKTTRWHYPKDPGATSVADLVMINDHEGLAIERDSKEGDLAALKRLQRISWNPRAGGGVVHKEQVADLMRLADPAGISGPPRPGDVGLGPVFALPFFTIEGLAILDARRVAIAVDNNYPFSSGRHHGSGKPDDSEIVIIKLATPLSVGPGHRVVP